MGGDEGSGGGGGEKEKLRTLGQVLARSKIFLGSHTMHYVHARHNIMYRVVPRATSQ